MIIVRCYVCPAIGAVNWKKDMSDSIESLIKDGEGKFVTRKHSVTVE
jgi:hypothetical protein